jgi:hypothetical protein
LFSKDLIAAVTGRWATQKKYFISGNKEPAPIKKMPRGNQNICSNLF